MQISEKGLNLLKTWEQGPNGGFASTIYSCSAGKRTIGYGHVITADEDIKEPISEATAEELLKKDVSVAEDAVNRYVKIILSQNRYDALVCFVFNVGVGNFEKSTLLSFVNNQLFDKVPDQFLCWNKITVNGKKEVSEGLTNRRKAELALWNGLC
jgi:GH24 family phage-related lysozyme (muramidase)